MIKVDVTTDTITTKLAEAERAVADLKPLMQSIGELMVKVTKENFKTGTAPDGTPWAPRSQATIDAYAAKGWKAQGGPLVGVSRVLSQQIFYDAGSNYVDWGSDRLQAAVMQLGAGKGAFGTASNGTPIPWGDIPARPFLGIGPEDENAILAEIDEYFRGLFEE